MYEFPTLSDSRVRAIIGTHPEGFFEAMKEFEPYTLIRASATGIEIKLKSSYVDMEKLKETFKHLHCLGYRSEVHNSICMMPNGERIINLDSITVDWKEQRGKELRVEGL